MHRFRGTGLLAILLLLVTATAYISPVLQSLLGSHVSDGQLDGIRSLILGVGGALIGATAIVTSLVLFAMQVNIERMPHGLFRRLSADARLLVAFALAFSMAISVATLSMFVSRALVAYVLLAASWGVVFILLSFLYAYRRALALINPLRQLGMLVDDTRKELRTWARRAIRAAPLLESEGNAQSVPLSRDSTHDLARMTFFRFNGGWDEGAKRAIRHAVSFARRYVEQGDYEVSGAALNAVVHINAGYVEAKGKTFYATNPFFDNPLAGDGLINDTLEHLRQYAQSGIARGDEQQIEQALQGMSALVHVYLAIDYSTPERAKSHAQLAATYLADAVQAAVPHGMPDVLLEGQRLLGLCAQNVLARSDLNDTAVLAEKIALIAASGCAKEEHRPVTMAGMTQLANLTLDLLRCKQNDIRYAVKAVRQNVALVARLFLKVPDAPLKNNHSTFLGPYYSSTGVQSLRVRLAGLVNAISESEPDEEAARTVIRNIERWADGLYQTEKELLLEAIEARSQFTLDMIYWITGVTEILLAVSNAPACDSRLEEDLRDHARWLIATLAWIPGDEDTVRFVENFQLTEKLFEAAMDARRRDCLEVEKAVEGHLLSWAFKGGRYINGWGVLARGLCACAVIAVIWTDGGVEAFKRDIASSARSGNAPEQEVLDHAARNIRERAATLTRRGHWSSAIEQSIAKADHRTLGPLLGEVAGILDGEVGGGESKGRTDEPVA